MRMIQLTDRATQFPEYLDADDVSRIETWYEIKTQEVNETKTVKCGFLKRKTKTVTNVVTKNTGYVAIGSIVFMKTSKCRTFVQETPEQVLALIKD